MKLTLIDPQFKNPSAPSIAKWIKFARNYSLILGIIQLVITPLAVSVILNGTEGDRSARVAEAVFAVGLQLIYGTFLVLFSRKLKGADTPEQFKGITVPLNWLAGVSFGLAIVTYIGGEASPYLVFMHAVVCGRVRLDIHKYFKTHKNIAEKTA